MRRSTYRQLLLCLLSLLASLTGTSCILTPTTQTGVGDTATSFTFQGVAPNARQVRVESLRIGAAGLEWHVVASTSAIDSAGNWSVNVPLSNAEEFWSPVCEAAVFRAWAKIGTQSYVPLTADNGSCLGNRGIVGGTPFSGIIPASANCTTPLIVLHRQSAPQTGATYSGDLVIVGQEQASLYRCISTVQGSLTLDGGGSQRLSLPFLGKVTGNLTVTLSIAPVTQPDNTKLVVDSKLEAGALAEVGGDVTLTALNASVSATSSAREFGLDALKTLGGSLTLNQLVHFAYAHGLNHLKSIPHDLTIIWPYGEMDVGQDEAFLSDLETIGGNLDITHGDIVHTVLPKVTTVQGNAKLGSGGDTHSVIFQGANAHVLESLTTVGGTFTLEYVKDNCSLPRYPKLTSVGGMVLTGRHPESRIGATGAQPLVMASLTIADTDGTMKHLPFHPDASVSGAGAVQIQNNPGLCGCQIDTFVQGLRAHGYTGSPSTSNNGASASCGPPCPPTACP
jgi:hypothetical protein